MIDRELSVLRRRHAELEDDADARPGIEANCGTVLAVVTFSASGYPGSAGAYFACHPVAVGGVEAEGQSVTTTPDATQTLYAANLGTKVPPAGTTLLVTMTGGRWTFAFN